MSELEQENKQDNNIELEKGWIPFEEICPKWSKQINNETGELIDGHNGLRIVSHKYCIVGEAHGFSDSYCGWDGKGNICRECKHAAHFIFRSTWDKKKEHERIWIVKKELDKFVQHWNEKHG